MATIRVRIKASQQVEDFEDCPRVRAMISSGMAEQISGPAKPQERQVETAAVGVMETAMAGAPQYIRGPRTRR